MNPTLFEIGMAAIMVAVGVALVVWYSRYLAATSARRRTRMLARAGIDSGIARDGDAAAIMRDIRSRCQRCRSEDYCERWLAGKAGGDNRFCPNESAFRLLARNGAHIAT